MANFVAFVVFALFCQLVAAEDSKEDAYLGNFYDKLKQKCTAIGLGKKATVDGST